MEAYLRSWLICSVILFGVQQSLSASLKSNELKKAFEKNQMVWAEKDCVFPSLPDYTPDPITGTFTLKPCSTADELPTESELQSYGLQLCLLFFNISQNFCQLDNHWKDNAALLINGMGGACPMAKAKFGWSPLFSFMTKNQEVCKKLCVDNQKMAPVCSLLVAAATAFEMKITGPTNTTTTPAGATNSIPAPAASAESSAPAASAESSAPAASAESSAPAKATPAPAKATPAPAAPAKATPAPEAPAKATPAPAKATPAPAAPAKSTPAPAAPAKSTPEAPAKATPAPSKDNEKAEPPAELSGEEKEEKIPMEKIQEKEKEEKIPMEKTIKEEKEEKIPMEKIQEKEKEKIPMEKTNQEEKEEKIPMEKIQEKEEEKIPMEKIQEKEEKIPMEKTIKEEKEEKIPMEKKIPSSGQFMVYFIIALVFVITAYLVYHYRQKIMGYIMEGSQSERHRHPPKSDKSDSKVKYSKLNKSAEEILPSFDRPASARNYIY